MGLIKMITGSVGSTFRDAVKDYYRCDGMTNDVLCMPAVQVKRNGTVNNASDRVITNGSVFDVAIGQAALLVENGKVHDYIIATTNEECGQFKYDSTVEPSLLGGGLKDFVPTMQTMLNRFTAGGQSTNTMNLVYINLKEITNNPIGVGDVWFFDTFVGTRVKLSAHGTYTFKIKNPVAFYENLVMDINKKYMKSEILSQLKSEMKPNIAASISRLSPLCTNGFNDIYQHSEELANFLNESLSDEWLNGRGIQLHKVALLPNLSEEYEEKYQELQDAKYYSNTGNAMGRLVQAQGQAMVDAANNEGGAMQGFLGMGMATGIGGFNTNNILQQQMHNEQQMAMQQNQMNGMVGGAVQQNGWKCSCGNVATGKFCNNCGATKPVSDGSWKCACGNVATGKFCNNCGATKPVSDGSWKCVCGNTVTGKFCNNCGAKKPEDVGVVCPNCGTKFDDVNTRFCNHCGTKLK